jgi:hypothetical protein
MTARFARKQPLCVTARLSTKYIDYALKMEHHRMIIYILHMLMSLKQLAKALQCCGSPKWFE